jgi:hypothetical protein
MTAPSEVQMRVEAHRNGDKPEASHWRTEDLSRLVQPHRQLRLPERPEWRPHPSYLGWHREHVFKG